MKLERGLTKLQKKNVDDDESPFSIFFLNFLCGERKRKREMK